MTPDEEALLSQAGVSILVVMTWIITISILQGIFFLLFSLSTYIIIRRGFATVTKVSWGLFLVTVFCFLVATLHWCANIAAFVIIIRTGLVESLDLSLADKLAYANLRAQKSNIIVLWTELLPVISDAVVVWRAWALFVGQRWIMIGPILMLLATISTTFAYLGFTIQFSDSGSQVSSNPGYLLTVNMFTSKISLSLATNVVATLLIAYKLWTHRTVVVNNLGIHKPSRSQKVLLYLVESGILYCTLQAINVALNLAPVPGGYDSPATFVSQVIFAFYIIVSVTPPHNPTSPSPS
jgi:hypothetical protein